MSSFSPGASLVAQMVKNPPGMQETRAQSLGLEDPLEKKMVAHSVFLLGNPMDGGAWPVQSMESQRGGHN